MKLHFKGKSIDELLNFRMKIFLIILSVLLVFSFFSIWMLHLVHTRTLMENTQEKGALLAGLLAKNLAAGLYFEDVSQISQEMSPFVALPDAIAVLVYDPRGALLSQQLGDGTATRPGNGAGCVAEMKKILSGFRKVPNLKLTMAIEEDCFIFTTAVFLPNQTEKGHLSVYFDNPSAQPDMVAGYVQLALSKKDFIRSTHAALRQTLLFTVLLVAIAFFASWYMSREAVIPLKNLVGKIRNRMGYAEEQSDELGILDKTFDTLVKDLDQAFIAIDQLKNGLEDEVADRTRDLSDALRELRDTHDQMVHQEKMVALGRLVAGVAHEINNTTNFVSGALGPLTKRIDELNSLIDQAELGGGQAERYAAVMESITVLLDNIREGARRTNAIVDGLKNFSRPDEAHFVPVDINQALTSTLTLAYPQYKFRIDIIPELAEDLPMVEGVPGQLNQVFMNILLNAINAQPDHGFILIRTWRAGREVHILFQDGGPGIPHPLLERIFDPFFTTRETGKGTGLGLSITYGIVKKHRGEILVRSKPGSGAEFEVVLPINREEGVDTGK